MNNNVKTYISGGSVVNKPIVNSVKKEIKPLNNIDWSVGDKLAHSVYGEGIVLRVDGDLINIAFKDPAYGVKTLLGKHGSLSRV